MSLLGKIFVKLGLDNSEFKRGMNESKQEGNKFSSAFKKIGGIMAAAFSVRAIVNFARESIASYNKQAAAVAKLESVLKSTGNAAGITSKELQKYASELQNQTKFGDEVTLDAMARLATFKSVSKDIFKQAIASAQDLSTVLGTDLNSSVMQLGKALESPEIGLTMLRRSGVSFSNEQIAQIKKLVGEGKKQEAQLVMLTELQSQFGGAAKAAAETAGGAWTQVANAWYDLKETLGSAVENTKQMAKDLKTAITDLNKLLSNENLSRWEKFKGLFSSRWRQEGEERQSKTDIYEREREKRVNDFMVEYIKNIDDAKKELEGLKTVNPFGYDIKAASLLRDRLNEYLRDMTKTTAELGHIEQLQKEIADLHELQLISSKSELPAIADKLSLKEKELNIAQMTTKELREQAKLAISAGKRASEVGANKLGIPAGGRQLYEGLTALYGLGGQQTEADLQNKAKQTMDALFNITATKNREDERVRILEENINKMELQKRRAEDIANQISNAFTNIIGASVENLSDIISGTSKLDSSQLAAALLMPLADMAIAIGTIILTSGEAIQGLMKALTNPANAGVAVAAGLGLIAVGILAKAGLKALAKNGGQSGQGSTTSFTGGAGGFAPSVSQTKVEVFGKISGNDILLSSTRANIDKRR